MLALLFRSRIRRLERTKPEQPGQTGEVQPLRIPGRVFLNVSPNVKRIKVVTVGTA